MIQVGQVSVDDEGDTAMKGYSHDEGIEESGDTQEENEGDLEADADLAGEVGEENDEDDLEADADLA